jgi:hypothetical protein
MGEKHITKLENFKCFVSCVKWHDIIIQEVIHK